MRRAKTALLVDSGSLSLKELINRDRAAFSGMRVLYASEVAGVPIQEKLSNDGNVQSIFTGKGLLAFSDEIEEAMRGGQAMVHIGVRPLIDTNLFSDLPKLLTGKEFDTRMRVKAILDYLATTFGPGLLDWSFASLENMREAVKPDNVWPVYKSAAARYYLDHGYSKLTTDDFASYIPTAKDQWNTWLKSDLMWHQVRRRDIVYAVMLFAFLEAWNGAHTVSALRRTMSFCLDRLGLLPLKELYFAWKLLRGIHQPEFALKLYDEAELRRPMATSLNRIGAVAWDLFLFRWCETQMTQALSPEEIPGKFEFFVPAVTTLDNGLLAAIRDCPLRALLIHDEGQVVDSLFADELGFHSDLNEAMTPAINARVVDPMRQTDAVRFDHLAVEAAIKTLETQAQSLTGLKAS